MIEGVHKYLKPELLSWKRIKFVHLSLIQLSTAHSMLHHFRSLSLSVHIDLDWMIKLWIDLNIWIYLVESNKIHLIYS